MLLVLAFSLSIILLELQQPTQYLSYLIHTNQYCTVGYIVIPISKFYSYFNIPLLIVTVKSSQFVDIKNDAGY